MPRRCSRRTASRDPLALRSRRRAPSRPCRTRRRLCPRSTAAAPSAHRSTGTGRRPRRRSRRAACTPAASRSRRPRRRHRSPRTRSHGLPHLRQSRTRRRRSRCPRQRWRTAQQHPGTTPHAHRRSLHSPQRGLLREHRKQRQAIQHRIHRHPRLGTMGSVQSHRYRSRLRLRHSPHRGSEDRIVPADWD